MQKTKAIELLGGSTATAAEAIGISYQGVNQCPEVLPTRIADRVYAALARKAGALIVQPEQYEYWSDFALRAAEFGIVRMVWTAPNAQLGYEWALRRSNI